MLKHSQKILVFVLFSLCTTLITKGQAVTLEGYTIHKCQECETTPPAYEEISTIYHVDDELTELTLVVTGDCLMKDSLTFTSTSTSLNFNYNYRDQSPEESETLQYCWYSIHVVLENFEIPNDYHIIVDGMEIFISDEVFYTYMSSYDVIQRDTINIEDYYGQKQGRWIITDYYSTPLSDIYYENDIAIEGYHWVVYDWYGRLTSYVPIVNGEDQEEVNYYHPPYPVPTSVPYSSIADIVTPQ